MKYKEWNSYTEEEKKTLLRIWWNRFEQKNITEEETNKYENLITKCPDKMFNLAVSSYIMGEDNKLLLNAMRGNFVEQLLDSVSPDSDISDSDKEILSIQSNLFNAMLVNSMGGKEFVKILELTSREDSQ